MMLRMKREFAGSQNQILPVFDTLLLLDRNVDLLTPLATQLTYEGLIDEIYSITNGVSYKEFLSSIDSLLRMTKLSHLSNKKEKMRDHDEFPIC